MSRPLGDDERRSIDMRRVDDALSAIAETPLEQLDAAQWMDELDRALMPGNVRQPIETVEDAPVERPSKRAAHHEVGDAEDDDPDEGDEFSADRWTTAPDVDVRVLEDTEPDAVGNSVGESSHDESGLGPGTERISAEEVGASTESVSDTDAGTDLWSAEHSPAAQSSDPNLNLSSGLRGLIALRRNDVSAPLPGDPPARADDAAGLDAPADPESSMPGADDDTVSSSGPSGGPEPERQYATPPQHPASVAGDDAPIPLLPRGDTAPSGEGRLSGLRARFEDLEPGTRKGLKFLAAGLAALVVVGTLRSCVSSDDGAVGTHSRPAATSEPVAPTSTSSAEIPVPESAVGVLAPSGVSARCPDGSTDARLAFSSDKSKAWICKRALGIDGAVLEMTFPHPVVVTDVSLVPGFDYIEPSGIDRWVEHRVVTRVQWTIGDQRFIQEINPSRAGANIAIPSVETQRISMTVMQTAAPTGGGANRGFNFGGSGKQDESFAVSSIRITGTQP